MQELINRAKELLADGTVARVLGWKAGDLPYNPEPAYYDRSFQTGRKNHGLSETV